MKIKMFHLNFKIDMYIIYILSMLPKNKHILYFVTTKIQTIWWTMMTNLFLYFIFKKLAINPLRLLI